MTNTDIPCDLTTLIESTSISFPTANSLDLSSDDDLLEKQLLLNAAASSTATTTTTSSSFLDSTRLLSFDESSLHGAELDVEMDYNQEGATGSQPWISRYRMEQRKNSVTGVAGTSSSGLMVRFFRHFQNVHLLIFLSFKDSKHAPKLSKTSSKQTSYSSVLQTMISNGNINVKIADLGNACFDVRIYALCFEN